MGSFYLTRGLACVWVFVRKREWITQSDELGYALDPHPCTGACSHLYTVLHSGLQTPNYHWTDGRVHRLIDMKASFVGQTPDLTKTDTPDRFHCEVVHHQITKLFSLEKPGLTLYSCMMPFCWSEGGGSQDTLMDVLLWFPTVSTVTCCGGALGADGSHRERGGKKIKERKGKKERKNDITTHSLFWKTSVSCFIYFFCHMSKRDLSHSLPQFILIQQAKQHGFFYFLRQPGRWLLGVLHLSFLS